VTAAPPGSTDFKKYLDVDSIGAWTTDFPYVVSPEKVAEYSRATNEFSMPARLDNLAPPMFAAVVSGQVMSAAFRIAMPLGDPPGLQRVHGEHDITFAKHLTVGMRLRSRARFVGVRPSSAGAVVVLRMETRDEDDSVTSEQYLTTIVPGLEVPGSFGSNPPPFRLEGGAGSSRPERVVERTDPDQTYRYGPASGDMARFHLDEAYARSVGAPGIILQGLCTMAFITRAVVRTTCAEDQRRLTRIALRFSRPVFPGQEITTSIWRNGAEGTRAVFGFDATSSNGVVARYGRAEVEQEGVRH
jgi:acyl dehydratase